MEQKAAPKITEALEKNPDGQTAIHTIKDESTGQSMSVNLSVPDLMAMMKGMMTEVVAAMKAPTKEEQKKLDEEAVKRQEFLAACLAEGKQAAKNKALNEARCGHVKPDGSTAYHGQIHSDGLIHPICIRCQKLRTPYAPPAELIAGMGF